jgi:hypothetical protein
MIQEGVSFYTLWQYRESTSKKGKAGMKICVDFPAGIQANPSLLHLHCWTRSKQPSI